VAASRAIVTPAAKDELRDRGIALQRGVSTDASDTVTTRTLLFAAEERCDTDALARSLRPVNVGIETVVIGDLANTVDALAGQVARDGTVAVIATARPAAAVCLANRHMGVRAVAAGGIGDVERAVAAVGANMLVIDTVGTSTHTLRMAVRRFAELAPRRPPSELAARLG
jgi:hypothetical protein